MWLPAVLLLTGALAPSALMETVWVVGLTALLTLATDRALAWPRALVFPAAVTSEPTSWTSPWGPS